ncbi:MAG: hypothetical protein KME64_35405 [Scytonematopsis contorta HA4267-MV1]|jgi:hypothetical protein|nr:hypothetical protein [Scytonematopsis contorta HA4267-MV1]
MEIAIQIINNFLFISIWGFSYLFITIFILSLQEEFKKHLTQPVVALVEPISLPQLEPQVVEQKRFSSNKYKTKTRTTELRYFCDIKGIDWYFTSVNPETGRKRHMTMKEMEQALVVK